MADYELMPYDHSDLNELREVYTRCFGRDVGEGYFRWKYLEGPAGHAVSFVARMNGMIAAYYGVLPEHYMVEGSRTTVYQSMDTMTHPDHRGKGLFTRLAKATYAHVQETTGGMHLIGYPGPTSINGFTTRLGWSCLVDMKYHFVYPWSFRAATMLRSRSALEVHRLEVVDQRVEAYFQGHRPPDRPIAKVMDKDVLAWRTFGHPTIEHHHLLLTRDGQGVGMCIYRVDVEGRAMLLWLDARDVSDMGPCTEAVLRHLFEQGGIPSVHTFLHGDPSVAQALRGCGALVNPIGKGPYSYRTPFIVLADPDKVAKGAYDIERYWIQPITRDY